MLNDQQNLYLERMKHCLINTIYGDNEFISVSNTRWFLLRRLNDLFQIAGMQIVYKKPYEKIRRKHGLPVYPLSAHTMIGISRLNNLQRCIDEVLEEKVPGDFIEAGVWRGGATIFMRAMLKTKDVTDRYVWVADSFDGLPAPDTLHYPHDNGSTFHNNIMFQVSINEVKDNFCKYSLLDDQVKFLPGWSCDTLPTAPIEKLSILRLDADMYKSTYEALEYLYPKLSVGG